ncbi:2-hydroxyacid dehydrogenase homolog [Tenacibaculum sp. 190524A02b]|uniref:2-hydroxyacid dehydrogenase homolog n=1 Tax=Tenacibaculum vairaonense TaxID=3137860 RepID=A0ABP1FHN5_9FLAO
MKTLIYSTKLFEKPFLESASEKAGLQFAYTNERLSKHTVEKAKGYDAIAIFSADDASFEILKKLKEYGVHYITLRSAGYDNVDLKIAKKYGIQVANVPEYSPNAIAEHAIALLMTLKRNIITANQQVKKNNFSLNNLIGSNLENKTVGLLGAGRIGSIIVKILYGFDCNILVNDITKNQDLIEQYNVTYTTNTVICKNSDVIIVSLPLTDDTHYLIDDSFLNQIQKKNVLIVNIARGGIVKTTAILEALKSGKINGYATDVYEKESGVFFYKHASENIQDEILKELINHPNVLLTPHQAFATEEAITNIVDTTIYNLNTWKDGKESKNELN